MGEDLAAMAAKAKAKGGAAVPDVSGLGGGDNPLGDLAALGDLAKQAGKMMEGMMSMGALSEYPNLDDEGKAGEEYKKLKDDLEKKEKDDQKKLCVAVLAKGTMMYPTKEQKEAAEKLEKEAKLEGEAKKSAEKAKKEMEEKLNKQQKLYASNASAVLDVCQKKELKRVRGEMGSCFWPILIGCCILGVVVLLGAGLAVFFMMGSKGADAELGEYDEASQDEQGAMV